jgi:hypothetical protein
MQPFEPNNDRLFGIVLRLAVACVFGTAVAMFWLWDTMSRQECFDHTYTVTWKGIRVCASATQAHLWQAGSVSLVVFLLLPLGTNLFAKLWRGRH